MQQLKNALTLLVCLFTAVSGIAQNTNNAVIKGAFVLKKAGKLQNSLLDESIKHISQGVIFRINETEIHADSAVVYIDQNRFEAFGNIIFYDEGKVQFKADRAYYRSSTRHITFMENVVSYNLEGEENKIKWPLIEFDLED